MKSKFDK